MDFKFSNEQEAFRQEVKEFLDSELPTGWVGYEAPTLGTVETETEHDWEFFKCMGRKFGEKDWLSLSWPKEYGGQARSHIDSLILAEEIAYRGAPGIDRLGVQMVAPTLIDHGTEAQKKRYLAPIARGEIFWCEVFSEPEAGSDLASLQTRAVRDDDNFIINGQKSWSTNAHHADFCILLARTDMQLRRHRGLSFFLVDMKTSGISIYPVKTMAGGVELNDVFFEDVRVPTENMVGEQNQGWYVAMDLLSRERASIPPIGIARSIIDDLINYAKTVPVREKQLTKNLLAQMAIETEIARLFCYRVAWQQDNGINAESSAAISRAYQTKVIKNLSNVAMQLLGLYGLLDKTSKWVPLRGKIEHLYLNSFAGSFATGTSEIQKNVIAMKGLGLPR